MSRRTIIDTVLQKFAPKTMISYATVVSYTKDTVTLRVEQMSCEEAAAINTMNEINQISTYVVTVSKELFGGSAYFIRDKSMCMVAHNLKKKDVTEGLAFCIDEQRRRQNLG